MLRVLSSCILGTALLLAACSPAPADAPAEPVITPVKIETAASEGRQEALSAFGTVEVSPDHIRTLTVPYDSVVVALRVAPGQAVVAGAPIMDVRPAPSVLLEQRRAQDALTFAEQDYARVSRLREQNLATNADLTVAGQALANARSSARDLAERIGAGHVRTIAAPIAGIVESVGADAGTVVPSGSPLGRVGDTVHLQVRLGMEIEDLVRISEGAPTAISGLKGGMAEEGKVTRILRRVDPNTRLAEVTVALAPGSSLIPGEAVRGEVAVGPPRSVITLSRACLVYDGDKASVFVVRDGRASIQAIVTGAEFADRIEVLSGLEAGVAVVAEGVANLENGARVSVEAAAR